MGRPVAPSPRAAIGLLVFGFLASSASAHAEPAGVARTAVASKVSFAGICEAAAASEMDERYLTLADGERDVLRVYDVRTGGAPVQTMDLSTWLDRSTDDPWGSDIQGAARVGGEIFWLTSHARGQDGRRDPARSRFFATASAASQGRLHPLGRPYLQLRKEILKLPELAAMGRGVRKRGAHEPGGLNLSALAGGVDGRSLLIGFRNPMAQGQALVLPLLNPGETIAGKPPSFGGPIRLDLQGMGLEELFRWGGGYVIVAAPGTGNARRRLFLWDGVSPTPEPLVLDLPGAASGPVVAFESRPRHLLILGTPGHGTGGQPCNQETDPGKKRLEGIWVRLL